MSAHRLSPSVAVIGAGSGGLALGILLRRAGFEDLTIVDREEGVGGTWRINAVRPGTMAGFLSKVDEWIYFRAANGPVVTQWPRTTVSR